MRTLRILLVTLLLIALPSQAMATLCEPFHVAWRTSPILALGRIVESPNPYMVQWHTYLSLRGSMPSNAQVFIYARPDVLDRLGDMPSDYRIWFGREFTLKPGDWAILGLYEADGQYFHSACAPSLRMPFWLLAILLLVPVVLVSYKRRRRQA